MSLIQDDIMNVAYKKLKQMVYHEKTFLYLRKQLAEFECDVDFGKRLRNLSKIVMAPDPSISLDFQGWLKDIRCILLPKNVKAPKAIENSQGTFVTNMISDEQYTIDKVIYIFSGPIELHLIAVLWLMTAGWKVDIGLASNCMGSRLHPNVGLENDHSSHLFKKYHELYAKWRDDGITMARKMLVEEERSVCIVALDFKEYYYRVQIDWSKLRFAIRSRGAPDLSLGGHFDEFYGSEFLGERLFPCVEKIIESYRKHISNELTITHPDLPESASCLPIGLCVSPVIANWYLREFDEAIMSQVRPTYYGRYVDDILMVVTSDSVLGADPIKKFMDKVLVNAGILKWRDDTKCYEVCANPGLYLQKSKCILQYFDAAHSLAGLEKFKKQIQENSSDFAMLPVDGDDSPVEQVAYELLYEGSVNKLRSVKEVSENRWELAKHLHKQTQLHLVAGKENDPHLTSELFRFFKGRNGIDYWDMWERVIAFLIISENNRAEDRFLELISIDINNIFFHPSLGPSLLTTKQVVGGVRAITANLRLNLLEHLRLARELSFAVCQGAGADIVVSNQWRSSNLIRHHLVAVPLLNYTDYSGNLADPGDVEVARLDPKRVEFSPRYVHFDECMGFVDSGFCRESEVGSMTLAMQIYNDFHGTSPVDVRIETIGRGPTRQK